VTETWEPEVKEMPTHSWVPGLLLGAATGNTDKKLSVLDDRSLYSFHGYPNIISMGWTETVGLKNPEKN